MGECSSGTAVVVLGPSVGESVSVTHTTRNLFLRNCPASVTVSADTAVMFSVTSEAEYAVKSLDVVDKGGVVGSG